MSYYLAFASVFAIAAAKGSSPAGHGVASSATDAGNSSLAGGGVPVPQPPSGNTAEAAFALSEKLNSRLSKDYLFILTGFVFLLLLYRVVLNVIHHTRTLACLNNNTQRYFAKPNIDWQNFKLALLYAPLFRARHKREIRLSSAVNMGTLPTRFQSMLLAAIIATNVTLCVYGIPWHDAGIDVLPVLRNRTGSIAVANLIPVMILSSPKNPFIKLLNIPLDSMNIIHRNLARLAILEAVVHTVCHITGAVKTSGWAALGKSLIHSNLIMTGTITILTLLIIIIQTSSAIRHAFYELFIHLHIALVVLALVFLWFHLARLPQRNYLLAAASMWFAMRLLRFLTFIKCNLGREGTKATVEVLPGEALRVSISAARKIQTQPGNYFYLYIPSVGLWTSHPFSIAWSDIELPLSRSSSESTYEEKIEFNPKDVDPNGRQTLSAVIRRRTGFTDSLYRRAENAGALNGIKLTLNAYVEAGYGVHQSMLSSCGTVMLFAAGVGVTHQIPYIRHLVEGYGAGTVAARKVILVWVTKSPEHLEWIRPWMTQILAMERRREVLMIKLFITQPKDGNEVTSPSATVQMFPGRPEVAAMIKRESATQIGCMGVSVCGPGGFSDDVRAGVRQLKTRNIEFVEEAFTW